MWNAHSVGVILIGISNVRELHYLGVTVCGGLQCVDGCNMLTVAVSGNFVVWESRCIRIALDWTRSMPLS